MQSGILSQPLNRRHLALGSALGLAGLTHLKFDGRTVFAQSSTDLTAMGFQTLDITITDSEISGVPESTPAGRYLVKVTSQVSAGSENVGAVGFVSPTPIGMSAADFIAAFLGSGSSGSDATPMDAASPDAEQSGGDESGALPLEVYQLRFAGGVFAAPGQTAMAVIDLTSGEYVVWGDDPSVPVTPAVLNVTGEMPADAVDPDSDVTVTLIDFAISFDGNLTPGKHIVKIQHMGAQPHFLDLEIGPDDMTKDEVMAALTSDMTGTPAADGFDESSLTPAFYSPTQSIGTVTWQEIELKAATYLAACFFPTAGTGLPHAMNGMVDVFTVSGDATPSY